MIQTVKCMNNITMINKITIIQQRLTETFNSCKTGLLKINELVVHNYFIFGILPEPIILSAFVRT